MINHVVETSETALRTMTPFVVGLRVRRLNRFNYLLNFRFHYHQSVIVRLTDNNGAWLVFFNNGHLLDFLSRNGLQSMAVIYD